MARPLVPRGGRAGPEKSRRAEGTQRSAVGASPSRKRKGRSADGTTSDDSFSQSAGPVPRQGHASANWRIDTSADSSKGKKRRRIADRNSRRPSKSLLSRLAAERQGGRGRGSLSDDRGEEENDVFSDGSAVERDGRPEAADCEWTVPEGRDEEDAGGEGTDGEEKESDDEEEDSSLFSPFAFAAMEGALHTRLVRTLQHHGFLRPTEIQELAIPTVLHGHDTLIQSYTGSGKTLCFALPLLQQLLQQHERSGKQLDRRDGTRCLLLLPTRELAAQACAQISRLAQLFPWIVVAAVTGGEKKQSEKRRLRAGVTVLLCTPGRLLDHLTTTSAFQVPYLHLVVLDEADRLLDMGFEAKIRKVMALLAEKKEEQLQMRAVRREVLLESQEGHEEAEEDETKVGASEDTDEGESAAELQQAGNYKCLEEEREKSRSFAGFRKEHCDGEGPLATEQHLGGDSHLSLDGEQKRSKVLSKKRALSVRSVSPMQPDHLCIRNPEDGFQVIMASATLTTQVQRLAAFCLRREPQWVSLERYRAALRGRRTELEDRQDTQETAAGLSMKSKDSDPHPGGRSSASAGSSVTFPCCCMLTPTTSTEADTSPIDGSSSWSADQEADDEEDVRRKPGKAESREEVFHVPEQLRQYFVKVQPRTRLLPLLSLLLEVAKTGKGKAVVFVSCCDAVEYLQALCTRLKWPGPIVDRALKQRQIEQLRIVRRMKEKHVARLQKAVSDLEKKKRKARKQSKAQDGEERAARMSGREDAAPGDGTDSSEEDEDEEEEDEGAGDELLGEFIFEGVKMFKLHGQMNRDDRIGYLKDFSDAPGSAVLFATDVAARGLNLPYVNWIAQFDLPQQAEEYVHRIGRTARLGKEGNALLFVLDCEAGYVDYLQSRGITVNEMDESRMLGTLFETHMPEYLRRIDNPSAFLVKQFSQFVSARHSLLQTARKAFLGTLRSFRALSKETRQICTHAALHTGHMASSFCLNEAPRMAALNLRRGAPPPVSGGSSTSACTGSRGRHSHNPAGSRSAGRPLHSAGDARVQKKASPFFKQGVSGAPRKSHTTKLKATRGSIRRSASGEDDGIIESVGPCADTAQRHGAGTGHSKVNSDGEVAAAQKGTLEAVAFAAKRLRERGEVLFSKVGGRQNKLSSSAGRLRERTRSHSGKRRIGTDTGTEVGASCRGAWDKRKCKPEPQSKGERRGSRKLDSMRFRGGNAVRSNGSRMTRILKSEFAC